MAAMINLLPDSKQARLRAQRTKRLMVSVGVAVAVTAVAVPILLFVAKQGQQLYLSRTQDQIDERKQTLKDTPDIVTMLTVKDHLGALPELYQRRLLASKLLATVPQFMPTEIRLTNMTVDTTATSITMTGATNSYAGVEKLQRALQQASVAIDDNKVEPDPDKVGHFTNVVLDNVSGPSGSEVTFTLTANFSIELIQIEADRGN